MGAMSAATDTALVSRLFQVDLGFFFLGGCTGRATNLLMSFLTSFLMDLLFGGSISLQFSASLRLHTASLPFGQLGELAASAL
jgi:hypothetical protein